jgi:hypothetical protein
VLVGVYLSSINLAHMFRKICIEVICFLFGLLFFYAALSKLLDYPKFVIQVGQSPLLTGFGGVIPGLVITVELALAVLLWIPRLRLVALYGSLSLMAVFTAYVVVMLTAAPFVPCSCGGILEALGWREHAVFNSGFVLMGVAGILLQGFSSNEYADDHGHRTDGRPHFYSRRVGGGMVRLWKGIGICLLTSAGLVVLLAAVSSDMRGRQGSFLRVFPPHPIAAGDVFDLGYPSYYLAGGTEHHVYLANYTSPLHLVVVRVGQRDTQHVALEIKGIENEKFWSLRVTVDSPYYYLTDGTVPVMYRGRVSDWVGERVGYDRAYFQDLVPIAPGSFFIRALDKRDRVNVLGKMGVTAAHVEMKSGLLQQQVDGIFCTDGMMHFNREHNRLLYLYRYRNEMLTLDTNLSVVGRHHTIDTTTRAAIEVRADEAGVTRFASPMRVVNQHSSTTGNLLLVHSKLVARNEHPKVQQRAGVIDVYVVDDGAYRFSFYVHDYQGREKMKMFLASGNKLYVLYERHVQVWEWG